MTLLAPAAATVAMPPVVEVRASAARRPVEVAVVLGTRSEAVALAPVVRALRRCGDFTPLVISTGQQRGVLDQVLRPLGVRPDVDLALARGDDRGDAGGTPRRLGAADLERLGELLAARRPEVVLVHGDSATAFGAALAACSEGIAVGHLGAGSAGSPPPGGSTPRKGPHHGTARPLPEEANQRLIAPLARWHLAPTEAAAAHLLAEGIDASTITVTGTTGIDALLWAASLQRGTSAFAEGSPAARGRVLACLRLRDADRDQLAGLAAALRALADDGLDVVLPVHPDGAPEPLLAELGARFSTGADGGSVRLVPPMEYLDFVATMRAATAVVTDSAAVEEEAPALGVPVLVVRRTPDGGSGAARLVGPDPDALVRECRRLADDPARRAPGGTSIGSLGEGRATERVLDVLAGAFCHPARTPGVGERGLPGPGRAAVTYPRARTRGLG